jgi:hypothetical protein
MFAPESFLIAFLCCAKRRRLPALRLYTNAAMTENLSIYAHIGFVETHRAVEKGFNRVYLRWTLPGGEE